MKLFRKLHLWLSVPFGLIITLVCFSGAMLIFEPEITRAVKSDVYYAADASKSPLPMEMVLETVKATLPDSVEITGVTIDADPSRTWQVNLSKPRRASVFVDQYTGKITGRYERLGFFSTMFKLHRWLLDSANPHGEGLKVGKLLVGISTLMFVIALITGVVIWWPRARKNLRRSLTLWFNDGWRGFWKSLHVAGGMYALIFVLAMALTGLTWSFDWYRTAFYAVCGVEHTPRNFSPEGGAEGRKEGRGGRGEGRGEHRGEGRGEHHRHGEEGHRPAEAAVAAETPSARQEKAVKPVESVGESSSTEPAKATEAPAAPEVPQAVPADTTRRGHRHNGEGRRHRHEEGEEGEGYRHHRHAEAENAAEAAPAAAEGGDSATVAPAAAERRERPERGRRGNRQADAPRHHRQSAPATLPAAEEATQAAATPEPEPQTQISEFACWQQVFDSLHVANPDAPQITVGPGNASVTLGNTGNPRAADRYSFDTATGEIISSTPYADSLPADKLRGWIFAIHTGALGGLITRLLWLIGALLGATLPLTGYYIWIKHLTRKHPK